MGEGEDLPKDIDEIFMQDRMMLIKELYAEDDYRSGIIEARTAIDNLTGQGERYKFYIPLCKLLSMGYRKWGKSNLALSTINDAIIFATNELAKDHSSLWEKEIAILHVNKGTIYDSIGNQIAALNEFFLAESVFEKLEDFDHLALLYQTMAGTYIASKRFDEAEETLKKLRKLPCFYKKFVNQQIIQAYLNEIKENTNEND